MAAECCRDPGVQWTGQPSGCETTLDGVQVYLAKPAVPTDKAAILISDAFGYKRVNIRLLADAYAAKGYLVVVPDVLNGDWLTEDELARAYEWFASHPVGSDQTLGQLDAVISELRSAHGVKHVVTEGFCWGGCYAVSLAKTDKVSAATVAHGSLLQLDDFKAVKQPTQLLLPESDPQWWSPEVQNAVREVLSSKDFPHEIKVYPGTTHGFAIRGAFSTEDGVFFLEGDRQLEGKTTAAANQAAADTIAWWNQHVDSVTAS